MGYSIDRSELDFVYTDLDIVDMEYSSDHAELDIVDTEQDIVDTEQDIVDMEQDFVDMEQDFVDMEQDFVDTEQDFTDMEQDFVDAEQDFVQMVCLSDRVALNIAYYCGRFSDPATLIHTSSHRSGNAGDTFLPFFQLIWLQFQPLQLLDKFAFYCCSAFIESNIR